MMPRIHPLAVVALVSTLGAAQPTQITADQLIARNLQALGGLKAIQAIHTLRVTSRLGVAELPSVQEWSRPMRFRQTVKIQGMTWTQAYDGKAGWVINPFAGYGGLKEPQPMNPEELKAVQLTADLDGPLVDWKAKGHTVTYEGMEDVDGSPAYKLKVALKDGDEITYYLDEDTAMVIKEVTRRIIRGTEQVSETILGNYEATGGVYFPHLIQEGEKGSDEKNFVTVDKVEINPEIPEDRFAMPAKKAQ